MRRIVANAGIDDRSWCQRRNGGKSCVVTSAVVFPDCRGPWTTRTLPQNIRSARKVSISRLMNMGVKLGASFYGPTFSESSPKSRHYGFQTSGLSRRLAAATGRDFPFPRPQVRRARDEPPRRRHRRQPADFPKPGRMGRADGVLRVQCVDRTAPEQEHPKHRPVEQGRPVGAFLLATVSDGRKCGPIAAVSAAPSRLANAVSSPSACAASGRVARCRSRFSFVAFIRVFL